MIRFLPTLAVCCWPASALRAPAPLPFRLPARIQTVESRIIRAALDAGVLPHVALAVAWRESKFNVLARHENRNKSVDNGIFQLNDRYFAPGTVQQNIETGIAIIAERRGDAEPIKCMRLIEGGIVQNESHL